MNPSGKIPTIFTVIIGAVFLCAPHVQASCLSLGTDLYPGDTNQSVTFLQNFLASRGYLSATPTGHYGPATTAAVKIFQKANNISQTGNVGPLTRTAISNSSCSAVIDQSSQTSSVINSVTPTPTPNPAQNLAIVSPATGDTLTIGKTYTINWNVPVNYFYDIVLDKSDGSSGGFILHNGSAGNSYSWRAGTSFSSLGDQTMATGTYRIHIQHTSGIVSSSDPVSGWFTLEAAPITLTSMNPSTAPADAHSAVVLFGGGFDSSSAVRLDSETGQLANTLYISPDGTVVVFTIPTNISYGRHSLFVNNQSQTPVQVGSIVVTN